MKVRELRVGVAGLLIVLLAAAGTPDVARADWFFGLFGSSDKPPDPTTDTLPYTVTFEAGDKKLNSILQDSSDLYRLRQQPPPNGEALAQRVSTDLPRLVDALWAEGYYDAAVRARVADTEITLTGGIEAAARAADRLRGRALVPITVSVEPGAQYHFRSISVLDAHTRQPFDTETMPQRVIALQPGDPARAEAVRNSQGRVVDRLRSLSFPLAKLVKTLPVVVHPEQAVDITITVDSGPRAGIGDVAITGTQDLDPAVVRSFIYTEPGDPYSPERIAAMRRSIATVEAVGGVKILESDHLDANGNLPLTVNVTERKKHALSLGAQYSTVDGPSVRAAWTDRNLFGGGERLRLESTLGFTTSNGGDPTVRKLLDPKRLLGRTGMSFIKPALWGSRNDLLFDAYLNREVTDYYTASFVNVAPAIRHRFTDTFYVQAGLEYERGTSKDVLGKVDYTLFGVPLSAKYDSTDNLLDPTRGFRILGSVAAYPKALGSSINLFQTKVQASTYFAIDEAARTIIAARVGFGSLAGAELTDIPDNRRFFAGGGGSVRGFAYRSLSPLGPGGIPIGGRSLLEASLEARFHVTDTIGLVPFVDAGSAFASSYPDFRSDIRTSAGLGLRYYTSFGPLRLDVAVPINRRHGDAPVAVYVGIGQAF